MRVNLRFFRGAFLAKVIFARKCSFIVYFLFLSGLIGLQAQHNQPVNTDIWSGSLGSTPVGLTNISGELIFQAARPTLGTEPQYISGPCTATMLRNVNGLSGTGSAPRDFTNKNGEAFYFAIDWLPIPFPIGTTRRGVLYRTQFGGSPSTTAIFNIFPGDDSQGSDLEAMGDSLYFAAIGPGGFGKELWYSDGRTAGEGGVTGLAMNINATGGSFPTNLTSANTGSGLKLFFSADDGAGASESVNVNREVWVRDYNSGTTQKLSPEINPGGSSNPYGFIEYNGFVYFFANDGGGYDLYRSNGVTWENLNNSGVFFPFGAPDIDESVEMAISNATLYFVANATGSGNELWRTDGSTATEVSDITGNANNSDPHELTDVDGVLYFVANDGVQGTEIWRSNGQAASTERVSNITTGSQASNAKLLTNVGGYLYFFARNQFGSATAFDLFVIDPNAVIANCGSLSDVSNLARRFFTFNNGEGATSVSEMVAAGTDFYFSGNGGDGRGIELWCAQSCGIDATINYNEAAGNALCGGSGSSSPTISGISGAICPTGNCFCSDDPNLVIDSNTGEIDLVNSPVGLYTVVYTYDAGDGFCRIVKSVDIEIQPEVTIERRVVRYAGSVDACCSTTGWNPYPDPSASNGALLTSGFNFGLINTYTGNCKTVQDVLPAGSPLNDANISMAFSPDGTKLYVADEFNHCIRMIDLIAETVEVFAGSPGIASFQDGTGTGAFFRNPSGIDVDAFGNIYVADKGNHSIRRIDPNTRVVTRISGVPGSISGDDIDNPNSLLAEYSQPTDVAVAADGTIYVSDKNNHKIKRIAPSGAVTTFVGGQVAEPGFQDGTGTIARFRFPAGIELDGDGNLIVADRLNHRIRRVTPAGVVTTIAGGGGTGNVAPQDVVGDASTARFYHPSDVTVSPTGDIYIADRSNHKIKLLQGSTVSTYAGSGIAGYNCGVDDPDTGTASFYYPVGLAVDLSDQVYILDKENQLIRRVELINPVGNLTGAQAICGNGGTGILTLTGYPDEPDATQVLRWESSTDGGATWSDEGNGGSDTFDYSGLAQSTLFRVIVQERVCGELPSNTAFVEVSTPDAPLTTPNSACADPGGAPVAITLTASGSTNEADYVWYDSALNNLNNPSSTLIVNVSSTTEYFVAISKGGCESELTSVIATVNPLPTPNVTTSTQACENGTQIFQTPLDNGNTYTWTVSGGLILPENSSTVSELNRNQINVQWLASGTGTIELIEENSFACTRSITPIDVSINPLPTPTITGNVEACEGETLTYSSPANAGNSYNWVISAGSGTIDSGQGSNEITVTWQSTGTLTLTETVDATTCTSTTSPYSVTVNPLPTPVVSGATTVCEGDVEIYSVPLIAGHSYNWVISAGSGTIDSGQGSNEITVTWQVSGDLTLEETIDATSCVVTTLPYAVTVNPQPTPVITGPATVCADASVTYSTPLVAGNSYNWTILSGSATIESGQGTNEVIVSWQSSGEIGVQETVDATTCTQTSSAYAVSVNPLPIPVISGPATVCAEETVTYSVPLTTGHSYNWTISAGSGTIDSGQGSNEITVTWQGDGSLDLEETIDATACNANAVSFPVTVNPLPTPVISGPATVCAEEEVTYSSPFVAGHSYNWLINSGAATIISGQGTNEITLTWQSTGDLILEESIDATTCNTSSAPYAVTVNPLPTPVITGPATVCADAPVTYSTPLVAGNSYNWVISAGSGTIDSGQGTNEITVTWQVSGEITLEETIDATTCNLTTDPYVVTVNPLPTPTISGNQLVCRNDIETYSVDDISGNSYAWNLVSGGTITSAADQASISIEWTSAGTHTLELTQSIDATTCNILASIDIEVGEIPNPVITGNASVCEAEVESYSILSTTNTINWLITGGVIVSGQGTEAISVRWDDDASAGVVEVTETDPNTNCSNTVNSNITINAKPEPLITGPEVACQVDVSDYSVSDVVGDTYTWTVTGGTFTGQGTNQIQVTWDVGAITGLVEVSQSNPSACDSTVSQSVTLIEEPDPTITGDDIVCAGETGTYTTTLAPSGQNYIYNWTITGIGTILSGQGTNQVEIQWDEMIADPTYLQVSITVEGTSCEATTPIPMDAGSYPVSVNPLPNPVLSGQDVACEGQVLTYTTVDPLDAGSSYTWNVVGGTFVAGANPNEIEVTWGSIGTGSIELTQIFTATNCSQMTTLAVDIQGSPGLPQAEDRYLCDTNLSLDLSASEGTATDFNWYTSDTEPLPFDNGATISVSGISATVSYWVSAVNAAGCEGPREEVIVELNPPVLPWTADGIVTEADSCVVGGGDSPSGRISLNVSDENGPYTFAWTKDLDAGFNSTNQNLSALTRGTYRVQVTDAGGCSQYFDFLVEENLKEITDGVLDSNFEIVLDTAIIGIGDDLELRASATDAVSYEWLDESGALVGTEAILAIDDYRLPSQTFMVTITNDRNCSITLSVYIDAVPIEIFIPNIFSPNGDLNNDLLQVYGTGIKSVNFRVFNRLGELLFETDRWIEGTNADDTVGWDGVFKGTDQPSGGYVWHISGKFVNNRDISFQGRTTGNIVLVR